MVGWIRRIQSTQRLSDSVFLGVEERRISVPPDCPHRWGDGWTLCLATCLWLFTAAFFSGGTIVPLGCDLRELTAKTNYLHFR